VVISFRQRPGDLTVEHWRRYWEAVVAGGQHIHISQPNVAISVIGAGGEKSEMEGEGP
jgi:hypothetical protein